MIKDSRSNTTHADVDATTVVPLVKVWPELALALAPAVALADPEGVLEPDGVALTRD